MITKQKGKPIKKMIEMINTTDTPYEIHWQCKSDSSNGSIVCQTPNAFISSGKHFFSSFVFTAADLKIVEAVYTFYVPSHNISADILIVGKLANVP